MSRVTFITPEDTRIELDAEDGMNLMQLATMEGIEGIDGSCGGAMSCATCHVHVDDAWVEVLAPVGEDELNMLDFVEDLRPCSRLGCQIVMSPALDGLVVRVPALVI